MAFDPLRSERPLIVYFDIKSPYAFVALAPTRRMASELGVAIDWRPLTLDIASYLGSARLDERGRVAESRRSPEQWSAVRYAYRDTRRYAELAGHQLRGTEKIWDTSLIHIAFSWVRDQADDAAQLRFLDRAYPRFWRRDLDVEDGAVIEALLREIGAPVDGFAEHAAGAGQKRHDAEQQAIFDAGIYGVPTYVLTHGPDAGDWFFGREHLPTVAWSLAGGHGPRPDMAYRSFDSTCEPMTPLDRDPESRAARFERGADREAPALTCCIDVRQPESYLALGPVWDLADELDLIPDWLPFAAPARRPPPAGDDRGSRHRRYRARAQERDLERYAAVQGIALRDWYRHPDPSVMCAALLALRHNLSNDRQGWRQGLEALFAAYWEQRLDLTDLPAVAACVGLPPAELLAWVDDGPTTRSALVERGVFTAPSLLFDDQLFVGRAHLPLLRWYLEGRPGTAPV